MLLFSYLKKRKAFIGGNESLNGSNESNNEKFPQSHGKYVSSSLKRGFFDPGSKVKQEFKDLVYRMLAEHKNMHHDEDQLRALQAKVEDLTMKYNEECLFAGNPSLLERFIKSDLPNARDYLKGKYKLDKVDDNLDRIKVLPYDKGQRTPPADGYKDLLNEADKELINSYGCHDIEAILIHILSCLFNVESSVSCATLIEKIEHLVRTNAHILYNKGLSGVGKKSSNSFSEVPQRSKREICYPFGTALVEFLVERDLIELKHREFDNFGVNIKKKERFLLSFKHSLCRV